MKKSAILAVLCLCFVLLTACGGDKGDVSSSVSSKKSSASASGSSEGSAAADSSTAESAEQSGASSVAGSVSSAASSVSQGGASSTAISAVSNPQQSKNGLIAAFVFNQGSGNTVKAANDEGFATVITEKLPEYKGKKDLKLIEWKKDSKIGNYLDFLAVPSAANFYVSGISKVKSKSLVIGENGDPFTISAWINPSAVDKTDGDDHSFRVIIAKSGNETLAHWDFKLLGDNRLSFYAHNWNSADRKDSSYVVPENKWTHVMITCDGKEVTYYANGKNVTSYKMQFENEIIGMPTGPYTIGGLTENVYGFCGGIAEVKVYSKVMKPAETTSISFS